ncbi:E3 ubiquitin-protein ligase RNF180 [Cryptotermes secundus]|uniref:E3 ubiquitin-protein ligase RNF180 n=1 Tax=Cryptotermes secundus TaxID=105785 RepID=UPI000CD7BCDC|nr:E3 ubiquitin-protein ligase RNF180 [Cryptotermes secundus]
MSLKCRKCRQVLLTQHDAVLTAHGEHIGANAACAAVQFGAVFYLQEDRLPAWIETIVDKEGWVKGRLHCPKCQGRVGAFDFVSGQKCACGLCLLPAVHLIRSKVDQEACVVPQERE